MDGNTPNKPAISEMEQAVMTEFFENLQLLVGTPRVQPESVVESEKRVTTTNSPLL
jgi:hypothetical protein